MKTIAIVIAVLLAAGLSAQETNPSKSQVKLTGKEKKEQREIRREQQFRQTLDIVNSQRYVLEADFLSNQYGYRTSAAANLNFIQVDTSDVVIQTGSNVGIGYNGVGGLTAKGSISSLKVTRNEKKKSMTTEMNVSTSIGFYRIVMNISADGKATATLSGNYAGRLVFDGRLVPLDASVTYKGSSY
jgi:hypothetical protein